MQKLRFTELGLSPELLKAVDKMGFEEAAPIQTAAIPPIMAGRDIVGQSSTGSGKTAAYGIPAIEKVDPHLRAVQVMILCPTRELALQVAEDMAALAQFKKGVHEVPIFGGQPYDRQLRALSSGVQIVIGTPGRVLDHMERGTLKLDSLRLLVLDEADRMLDMGFREDIERVLSAAPESRQLLFFSATMPRAIQELIGRYSRDPAWVKIEEHAQNAPQVDQVFYDVDRRSKIEALTRLIDMNDFRYGLIFCSTKVMVDELDEHLHARGYAVDRLHGDITQAQRNRVMEKFRRRGFEFLIATDVAARGLDIDDLEVVFNFDLPNDAEDYIHRIGRTGRAGKTGRAITFVSGRELYKLQGMVHFGKLKIRRERVPSLDEVGEAREDQFIEQIRGTLEAGECKRQERLLERLLEQGYASTDIAAALLHMMRGEPSAAPASQAPAPKREPRPPAPAAPPPAPATAPRAVRTTPVADRPGTAGAPPAGDREERHPQADALQVVPEKPAPLPAARPAVRQPKAAEPAEPRRPREKFKRPSRTGEPGFTTLFFNVGHQHLVTPADIVGKIAGVTRLPASVVGAIDIHRLHTLVDVAEHEAAHVLAKLNGVRLKNQVLKPCSASGEPGGGD